MLSAGETSALPKSHKIGPYTVDTNNFVTDGEYKGWQVGQCHHGSADGVGAVDTMRVPDLKLSSDEMKRLVKDRQYKPNFHIYLDGNIFDESGIGTVCLYYQNPSENRSAQEDIDCSTIFDESWGESTMRWLKGVARDYIPLANPEPTKCDKLKAFYGDYNPLKKPTFWENVGHASLFGLMFVVMHDVWQGMKGKQTILGKVKEKLFNGKGPKDPPDGTGGAGGGGKVEEAPEAAAGAEAAAATEAPAKAPEAAKMTALNPAMAYIKGEQLYFTKPAVQADLVKARVISAPDGIYVPDGQFIVEVSGNKFFMPIPPNMAVMPNVNIGAVIKVNPVQLRPIRVLAY